MPNENGTETSRSDALSAAESLFGDTTDDAAAAVSEEEPQGSDDAAGETVGEESVPADSQAGGDESVPADSQAGGDESVPPEGLKVVVSIKDGRATIGVQRPSSDPHIELFDGPDLSGLTQEALAVIERARAKWEEVPKYPTHERPAPTARRRPRREQGSTQASTAEGGADQQQAEALRLF